MKRACPFDNIIRSSKVHLSDYDVDEKTKKKVQEETIKKIMEASQKSFSSCERHTNKISCSYCDKPTDLLISCVKCGDLFCNNCSFKEYIAYEDKAKCITCS